MSPLGWVGTPMKLPLEGEGVTTKYLISIRSEVKIQFHQGVWELAKPLRRLPTK